MAYLYKHTEIKQKKQLITEIFLYLSSIARVCSILELGGTSCVSQILPPITDPLPIVILPKTEVFE